MLKKNFSVLQNAIQLGQVAEGLIGDNTAVFTPSEDSDRHYESAKRLAKYLNAIKVCKDSNDMECSNMYYPIKFYGESQKEPYLFETYSAVVLADGSIYKIKQYENCSDVMDSCIINSSGDCETD